MEKKFCRRVDIINYEYFTYDGTEEGRQKALEWVKKLDPFAELVYMGGNYWRLYSKEYNVILADSPRLLLYSREDGEFFSDSPDSLGKDYEILPTDYFDEDKK